ncbi:MAG TPA: adenylate/guanylate cyclase domain-containing protein [Actinomycetota bacterium]|nr:adenylate/guanylate cyclase domain-containing protein [Actinomycetota bacterium]
MATEGTDSTKGAEEQEKLADLNTRDNLEAMLDELIEKPGDYDAIKERIETNFRQERTILILDLSGFTRTTQLEGILPFLLMIHQMQRLALPSVEGHGGILVRADADNLTCLMDGVEDAITAAKEITERLATANVILPSSRDLYVSIGIGHGRILNVDNEAIFGNQVNLASKLGEDLAESGDVLLTEAAYAQIEESGIKCEKHEVNISGVELTYYSVL